MHIASYKELKDVLAYEKNRCKEEWTYPTFRERMLGSKKALVYKYLRLLRYDEYFTENKKILFLFPSIIVHRKRNRLGHRLSFDIPNYTCERGLILWHYNVIVNPDARIGANALFHGSNCIGNKGKCDMRAPKIGANADIGIGACVIGPVELADDVVIGANAVVTKSCSEKGAVLAGIPAADLSHR